MLDESKRHGFPAGRNRMSGLPGARPATRAVGLVWRPIFVGRVRSRLGGVDQDLWNLAPRMMQPPGDDANASSVPMGPANAFVLFYRQRSSPPGNLVSRIGASVRWSPRWVQITLLIRASVVLKTSDGAAGVPVAPKDQECTNGDEGGHSAVAIR